MNEANAWGCFDGDNSRERFPIETAPKDGTVIVVGDPDVGEFPMSWGHIQRNEFFAPGTTGMWVMAYGGGATWTDADGFGPTAWRPLEEAP